MNNDDKATEQVAKAILEFCKSVEVLSVGLVSVIGFGVLVLFSLLAWDWVILHGVEWWLHHWHKVALAAAGISAIFIHSAYKWDGK